jgi:hypothetical protein
MIKYEYIGTLIFESDKPYINTLTPQFISRIKTTCNDLKLLQLTESPLYHIINLGYQIVTKISDPDDIENKLKIISEIKKNKSYWNNCFITDLDTLSIYLMDLLEPSDSAKVAGIKRRRDLMDNTNEKVF